jgi:hypothetical protein
MQPVSLPLQQLLKPAAPLAPQARPARVDLA